ncbi:hypothetical protein ACFLU5_05615 [Bacteroidota bacterium]
MDRKFFFTVGVIVVVFFGSLHAQDSLLNNYQNAASRLLNGDSRLMVGGYAQVDYNQPIKQDIYNNGILDVHRFVLLFGYQFSNKVQFISEIEFEHVKEVYIEQAFLNYNVNSWLNFRAGLMLIPVGITNEYHEPPSFNGVERPLIDIYIAPTTWREIGFGASGTFSDASLKYQAYIVNGFKSYDGNHNLSGKSGLRGGRQKGAESFSSYPNFAGKLEYFGILGLNLGFSGYFGKTQSTLYDGIEKGNKDAVSAADSSVVRISMIGLDSRYRKNGWQFKLQSYFTSLSNTSQYNSFNSTSGSSNDLGKAMYGYYVELGYNMFQTLNLVNSELTPFIRWEEWDTHYKTDEINENPAYHKVGMTIGLGWKITSGCVVKTDFQFMKSEDNEKFNKQLNIGAGIWF